ncbi:MAG TPA: hypothetical protein VNG13_00815 [Mycobacteriales bacterium]|nr:hypothetical protein [Mycobacteriales bacterium]
MTATLTYEVPLQGLNSETIAALHAAIIEQIEQYTQPGHILTVAHTPIELDEDTNIDGWTPALAAEFLERLRADGSRVQADVIVAAARCGGSIERADVFAIAGWDATERSLKGFTRPVNRIVQQMREEDLLPDEAPRPIEPQYSETRRGYQQARGFEIPNGLAPLFAQ